MIDARRLYDTCFHAAVAVSQAFIAVVAGVAVAFALGPERGRQTLLDGLTARGSDATALGPRTALQSTD